MSAKRAARRRAAKIRAKITQRALPSLSQDSGSWDTAAVGELADALRAEQDRAAYEQRWQALGSEEQAELATLKAAADTDWDAYARRMTALGLGPRHGPEFDLNGVTRNVYEIVRDRLIVPGAPAQVTVSRAWLAQECYCHPNTVGRAFADLRRRSLLDIEALGNGTVSVRLGKNLEKAQDQSSPA